MMPSVLEFLPASALVNHDVVWSGVPDWTNINNVAGGPAASSFVHDLFGSNFMDTGIKKASYAQIKLPMTGPDAHVRVMSWSTSPAPPNGTGLQEQVIYGPEAVNLTTGPQNLAIDMTAQFNSTMLLTRLHQFIVQVRGTGKLHGARMLIEWRFPAALASQFI